MSPKEYEGAARICARAPALVDSRPAYIREHGLDPEIADPAANRGKDAENAIHNLFAAVAAAHYDVINRLRFYTQPFTGYELPALAMGVGKVHVLSPSEAADGQLAGSTKTAGRLGYPI